MDRPSHVDAPQLTIAIATLNCVDHLRRLFAAFESQTLARIKYEVILMDGGSTDGTREIGEAFGCRVFNRPELDVVAAKHLAFHEARGRILMFLDADEVPEKKDCLQRRVRFFTDHPDVHALLGSGFHCPEGYPFINQYVNDYGDPFSFFIYRGSKDNDHFIPFLKRRFNVSADSKEAVVIDFESASDLPLIELTGMGSTLDLDLFRGQLGDKFKEAWSMPHLFYIMLERTFKIGILYDDPLMHYSAERLKRYLYKLEWRVKNNIYYQQTLGASGFSGRSMRFSSWLRWKRLLFVPYVLLVLPMTVDALALMIHRRRWGYALHVPLCGYVLAMVFWHLALKRFGYSPLKTSYGGAK